MPRGAASLIRASSVRRGRASKSRLHSETSSFVKKTGIPFLGLPQPFDYRSRALGRHERRGAPHYSRASRRTTQATWPASTAGKSSVENPCLCAKAEAAPTRFSATNDPPLRVPPATLPPHRKLRSRNAGFRAEGRRSNLLFQPTAPVLQETVPPPHRGAGRAGHQAPVRRHLGIV